MDSYLGLLSSFLCLVADKAQERTKLKRNKTKLQFGFVGVVVVTVNEHSIEGRVHDSRIAYLSSYTIK